MRSGHFISFGNVPENLVKSLQQKVIGFRRLAPTQELSGNSQLYLYCQQTVFAIADLDGGAYEEKTMSIWSDGTYPFRQRIKNVECLRIPLKVSEETFGRPIEEYLGRGWGHKYVGLPRSLPDGFNSDLVALISKLERCTIDDLVRNVSSLIRAKN